MSINFSMLNSNRTIQSVFRSPTVLSKNKNANSIRNNMLNVMSRMGSERLSFYHSNRNNLTALLDAVNFFHGAVNADNSSDGFFSFGNDGQGQVIPKKAIARICTDSLPKLQAVSNSLCLSSNTYYSYKAIDGKYYACAFNGEVICRSFSEEILGNDKDNVAAECRGNTALTMSILSNLANYSVGGLHMLERSVVKNCLANLGITPGEFSISVDGLQRKYYMGENGSIYTEERALDIVNMYNSNTWLKGRAVGDKITVFGKEYEIQEDGHIHVPAKDFWVNEKCDYGSYDMM